MDIQKSIVTALISNKVEFNISTISNLMWMNSGRLQILHEHHQCHSKQVIVQKKESSGKGNYDLISVYN